MFKKLILAVLCAALVMSCVPAAAAAEQPGLSLTPVYEDGNVIRVEASLEAEKAVDYAQFTFAVSDGYTIQANSCEKVADGSYSVYSSLKNGVLTVTLEKTVSGFAGLTADSGVILAFDIKGSGSAPTVSSSAVLCYFDGTDSTWSGEAVMAAAQANGQTYGTLSEALKAGGTVRLLSDTQVETLKVPSGTVLDLNGQTLTASDVLTFGQITDSSNGGKGGEALLVVSNDPEVAVVSIRADNPQLPIYDTENGGYRFYSYNATQLGSYKISANAAKFGFRLLLDNAAGYELLKTTADSGMTMTVKLELPGMKAVDITYVYKAETVKTYAGYAAAQMAEDNAVKTALTLTVSGIQSLTSGQAVEGIFSVTTAAGVAKTIEANSYTVE